MEVHLPPELVAERDALAAEIYAAFGRVQLEAGVSWGQAEVLDLYGSQREFSLAKSRDKTNDWKSLVDDPDWDPQPGIGGFAFLDELGYLYYLPPAMVRCIRLGYDAGVQFWLGREDSHLYNPCPKRRERSTMDLRQARCVARFIRYMAAAEEAGGYMGRKDWENVLNGYWASIDEPDRSQAANSQRGLY